MLGYFVIENKSNGLSFKVAYQSHIETMMRIIIIFLYLFFIYKNLQHQHKNSNTKTKNKLYTVVYMK